MAPPIHLNGREHTRDPDANTLLLKTPSRAALLVMRAPALQHTHARHVRWKVSVQARLSPTLFDLEADDPAWITLLPTEITLDPLASTLQAVALAGCPLPARAWAFKFWVDEPHPDARADAWALALDTDHLRCGFFKLPESGELLRELGGLARSLGGGR